MRILNICGSVLLTVSVLFIVGACTTQKTDEVSFPSSLDQLDDDPRDIDIPLDSSVVGVENIDAAALACNIWIGGSGTRCGLVSNCENYTFAEAKRIGDRLAASVNAGTQAICNRLNCPNRQFRNIRWSVISCRNRMLCIGISYEFRCTD